MKTPYLNCIQRLHIRLNTFQGNLLLINLRLMQFFKSTNINNTPTPM